MCSMFSLFFFFTDTATTEIYTLSLHDALPISEAYALVSLYESGYVDQNDLARSFGYSTRTLRRFQQRLRSEEHTSELQSQSNLVCRLLLEKKKKKSKNQHQTIYYVTNSKH